MFQGFETRGTIISSRLTAWENLLDSISHIGPLTNNPSEAKRLQVIRPNQGTPLIQKLTPRKEENHKIDSAINTSKSADNRKNNSRNRRKKKKNKQKPDDLNWRRNRKTANDDRSALGKFNYKINVEENANRKIERKKVS